MAVSSVIWLALTNCNVFENTAELCSAFYGVTSESTGSLSVQHCMFRAEALRHCPVPVLAHVLLRYVKTHTQMAQGEMWKILEIIPGGGKSNPITVANGQRFKKTFGFIFIFHVWKIQP